MGRRPVRYLAALILLVYGFAKINGSQFTILDSELDKPMGQVSGFWLTWYYFGFSHVYGTFVALVEIAGAVLLMFQRTALLGACLLVPVLVNVFLIDVCYGVDPGAAGIALLLLLAMAGLIAPDKQKLVDLFFPATHSAARSRVLVFSKWGVRLAMLGVAFGFTYWSANFNNRLPTPIDGVWEVIQSEPADMGARLPKTLFFEYNRAYMTVFKTADGVYTTHHFEIDKSGRRRIGIWEAWLSKGRQLFDGRYSLADAELTLEGTWQGIGEVVLRLRRRGR
jgi:hypothetical protein